MNYEEAQSLLDEIITAHRHAEDFRTKNTTNRYPKEFKGQVKVGLESGFSESKKKVFLPRSLR